MCVCVCVCVCVKEIERRTTERIKRSGGLISNYNANNKNQKFELA